MIVETDLPEELLEVRRLVASIVQRAGDAQQADRVWEGLADSGLDQVCAVEDPDELAAALPFAIEAVRTLASEGADLSYDEWSVLAPWTAVEAGLRLDPARRTVAVDGGGLEAVAHENGICVNGRLRDVPWAGASDRLLLLLSVENVPHLAMVDVSECVVVAERNLAGAPRDSVELDDVWLDGADVHRLAGSSYAAERDRFAARGALIRVVQMGASASRILHTTISHLSVRTQFNRTLISLAPVRQELASMASHCQLIESAAAAVQGAIGGPESRLLTSVASAKYVAGRSSRVATRVAHQLHGAIGVTVEYPLERFTKRLWAWSEEYGNGRYWAQWLSQHLEEPASAQSVWRAVVDGVR